jgi:rod shape-determining protein MreD
VSIVAAAIIGLVLLVLDAALGGMLTLGAVRPSLTLPLIVYVGLRRGPIEGTLFGFALGLGQDMLGALPLGATSLAYTMVGFACGKLWPEGTFRLVWPWGSFLLTAALFVEGIADYLISRGTGVPFFALYVRTGVPAAFYTTGLGLLWFLSPLHRVRTT